MALSPIDEAHALQIQAGTLGRKTGHDFEEQLAQEVNELPMPFKPAHPTGNLHLGTPAAHLLHHICAGREIGSVDKATAISTGALATSEEGKSWLEVQGAKVFRCKSDIVLTLHSTSSDLTVGVSVKQCNNKKPTNAQLYFTTATGFVSLLRSNGLLVSDQALKALKQFCGDAGYKPSDSSEIMADRVSDPRRYFWEEVVAPGREELEKLLHDQQDTISRLLFQKAYLDDPFAPDYLIHKTHRPEPGSLTEAAIYSIEDLVEQSRRYGGFSARAYSVRKGTHKDPPGVRHLAPRFGIIQMQRGGQRQHPEQLQFNLAAGYFYKLAKQD